MSDYTGSFRTIGSVPGGPASGGNSVGINRMWSALAEHDTTAPAIASFVPSVSTPIDRFQSLQFDVTDNGALAGVFVYATFSDGTADVIHDGDAFASAYAGSTRTSLEGGFRYVVKRAKGWPSAVMLKVRAIDSRGNAT